MTADYFAIITHKIKCKFSNFIGPNKTFYCVTFIFLIYVDNKRKFEGQTILLYGMLYSLERFFVEGLRTDSLMIGPFRQAQVISIVIILVCIIAYIFLSKRNASQNNNKETEK